MKKGILLFAAMMLFSVTALAYNFGSITVDPNVGMQKEVTSPWYGNKKVVWFGDRPEVAMAWNKKDSTHGIMQLGFDVTGMKVLALTPKSMMGMSLSSVDLSNDATGMMFLSNNGDTGLFVGTSSTGSSIDTGKPLVIETNDIMSITSKSAMSIESEDAGILLTPDASSYVRIAGETRVDEVGIFVLTQEDVGATCALGEMKLDTGGATVELCYCSATNTWVCTPMASGPTD